MEDDGHDTSRASARTHILASINPYVESTSWRRREARSRSPKRARRDERRADKEDGDGRARDAPCEGAQADRDREDENDENDREDDKLRPRGGHLRFKARDRRRRHHEESEDDRRSRSPSSRVGSHDQSRHDQSHHDQSRHSHRHRHRHRRHRHGHPRVPREEEEDPYADPPLDPDAAFRQSLFDAMADDEGAAYWEAVYGQPVHEYAREAGGMGGIPDGGSDRDRDHGPDGIHAMTDEQYAEYVRRRMWERSPAGRLEARQRQAAEQKQRQQEQQRRQEADEKRRRDWDEVERSLRRGEARRRRKAAQEALEARRRKRQEQWRDYAAAWAAWDAAPRATTIPWPGDRRGRETGDLEDTEDTKDVVAAAETFFSSMGTPDAEGGEDQDQDGGREAYVRLLRDERVRWHPDKIQQRLGGSVDAVVLRDVTAVFQTVDDLWNAARKAN